MGKRQLTVDRADTLLQYLYTALAPQSRTGIKSLLTCSMIRVNGKTVTRHDFSLKAGDTITIADSVTPHTEIRHPKGIRIVYEDQWLIVAYKASGLPSIGTGKGKEETTAYNILTEYVRKGNPAGGIFIVHRLDRDTSGLILFSKDGAARDRLQDNWNDIILERKYIAIAEGNISEDSFTITSWLKENPKSMKVHSSQYDNGGKKAITHFTVLARKNGHTLVEAELETGRKNQIRVHLSSIGHPISGDRKYGAAGKITGRLALHAQSICFVHPTTGKTMKFDTGIPEEFGRHF